MRGPLLIALVLAVAATAPRTAAAGDPTLVWKTVDSAHFAVHYPEPLGAIARKVALAAERAHATLSAALRHVPRERTQIVITDDTDGSNGFASVLPRNDIRLFATAPSDISALNDHDDWLFGLVAHEYTHVLHLDAIGGIPRLYNRIFGKTWSPNQLQPRWVLEGLATYEESKRTSGGRTRNALFDMNLRMATLRGDERGLDEISNGPRAWPHGNAAYLYGSHFLKYVFDRFGDDKAAVMSHAYGSTPIPYGINRSIARATGVGFVELYRDWRRYRQDRYGLQLEAVERAGRREGRRLTFTGEVNFSPRYTRDGARLVWQRGDGYSVGQFRAMPVAGNVGASSTYAVIERSGGFDLLSDGSMVVEQTHQHRTSYDFQDLFLWDRATGELTAITEAARATDPAISPDEREVAFAMNGGSRRALAVAPIRPAAPIRVLWRGDEGAQAFSPSWSPDGRSIAFSAWRQGGYRDILIIDLATGAVRELMHDRAQDTDPVFSPDGALLYYSSDRTGIYNVYARDLATGADLQVTNVLGCALAPELSPDGRRMAYQGYDSAGYEVFELDLDRASFTAAPPYVDDRPDPVRIDDGPSIAATVSAPYPYRPLDTLPPDHWSLELRDGSLGRSLAATTEGTDAAGHHAYDLAATMSLEETNLNLGAGYAYRRLWPSLRVAANRTAQRRGGLVIDGKSTAYLEEALSATGSVGLPVLREPDGNATLSLDYDVDYFRPLEDKFDGFDPSDSVPRIPGAERAAGLAVRLSYADAKTFTYTVGPQQGIDVALSARLDHAALGADREALTLNYRAAWYLQIPLATPPALSFRLSGGLRASSSTSPAFALGGVAHQDIVRSIVDQVRAGASGYLRGYPERSLAGEQFHLLDVEWRQELWNFERGLETLPVYLRRVHYALLFDGGNAFDGRFDPAALKTAVGGALRVDFVLGYFLPGTLDLGYARGLAEDGQNEGWLLLTGTL